MTFDCLVTPHQLTVHSMSPYFHAGGRGMVIESLAILTCRNAFDYNLLEDSGQVCKMRLSAQRSLVSLSVYADSFMLL